MNIKRDIRFRVYVAFTCMCLLALAIWVKAAMTQIKDGHQLRALAQEMNMKTDTLEAERGNIYSEDGNMLCSTIPQFDAHVDMKVINADTFRYYLDSLAYCMSTVVPKYSTNEWKQRLSEAYKKDARYFLLAKNLKYYEYQSLRQFPILRKGPNKGGLIVETKHKRVNPYEMLAFRTIGLWRPAIWKDGKQVKNVIGLEATYDSVLSGTDGYCIKQRTPGSRWVMVDGSIVEPENGKDVITTIDMGIQDVAEHALKSVVEQYQCLFGTAVVMEVETGKIKAIANLGRQPDGSYWEDFNYALIPSEPGSTFKLATLYSLLSDRYVNVEDNVNCEGGQKKFAHRVMHDSHHGLGVMTIKKAFAQSSNVAMGSMVYQHYYKNPEKFVKHLEDLGFTSKTGLDLVGERKTRVLHPKDKDWNAATLPWLGIGYGMTITPMHSLMLYNAIANGGKMMKPYLVSSINEYGKVVKTFEPQVIKTLGDENIINQLKACLEEVVLSGTGKHIKSPFYNIAGKTGTAQVFDKGIKYSDRVYHGSFIGYFPVEKPKYTIAVVIRTKPHSSSYYGGTLAAPVFRMISDKIFAMQSGSWPGPLDSIKRLETKAVLAKSAAVTSYQNIANAIDLNWQIAQKEGLGFISVDSATKRIAVKEKVITSDYIPNVVGMGLKDAIYHLEKIGLSVVVVGSGTVVKQSISPGNPIVKGETIIIELS